MKKICNFIALFLMVFTGSVQAQHRWVTVGDNLSDISNLKAGEGNYYVIKEGDNTRAVDGGSDGHSQSGYLNSVGAVTAEIKHECVFSFIDTKTKKEGHTIYVLKNLANGQYLVGGGEFSKVQAKAFKFTVQKGENVETTEEWVDYSKSVSAEKSCNAVSMGAWVFCSPEAKSYMCFWGAKEPTISEYNDTNNWLIFEVKEEQMSAFEKLLEVFSKYFVEEVSTDIYPIGTEPGCISQELYDRLKAVYDEAVGLTVDTNAPEKECDRVREEIIKVFKDVKEQTVPVTPGYYILINQRSQDWAYDDNGMMRCKGSFAGVTTWDLASTKFIWKVIPSEEGKFFFQDWGTGRYIGKNPGTSKTYHMEADSISRVGTEYYKKGLFRLQGGDGWIHNDGSQNCVHWADYGDGNLWKIVPVSADTIAKLEEAVNQSVLNKQLKALVDAANNDFLKLQNKNGFIPTGMYSAPADSGLVRAFEAANATEPSEGKPEYAFDGKLDTYYHTLWHAEQAPADDWHWVQVDLGKEVQELVVKFSYRHNNNNGNPSRIALVASEDGNIDGSAVWGDTLYQDTVIYAYPTYFPDGKRDSTTYIDTIKLSKPVQHLRMAVTRTKANQIYGAGPCWHVSELRFYDLKDCVANPNLTMVPEEIRTTLTNAIAAAEAELAANAATAATYDALEAALDAFWEAYPDASGLKEALDAADKMAEKAQEGEDMGFFQTGAKDELKAAVAKIREEIEALESKNGALSLKEIEDFTAKLDKATAAFNAKLIVPEGGKIYRIVSRAGLNSEGEEREQSYSCIASANADVYNGTPVWRYKTNGEGTDGRLNALWLVEKSEKGFAFKNLANGLYMGNEYEGLTEEELEDAEIRQIVGYSKEPKHFQLETFSGDAMEDGSFLITLTKGQYVNLQPTGNVVHWGDRNDPHAPFTFEAVDDQYDAATYTVDVQAGKTQIVTLPVTVEAVYSNTNVVYEVLGKKDNTIQLKATEGAIEAGTPFIITTQTAEETGDEAESKIDCEMSTATAEECLNLTYNYEPVVKNGLVSAPYAFTIPEGTAYGVLYGTTVIASEGGDEVAAATGFFNNTLPEIDEEGVASLIIEGDITGEGTAVEKVEIVKNVPADVYTLSGVKVRQNVKAGVATQGLPKGVYIVGGKKVVVK